MKRINHQFQTLLICTVVFSTLFGVESASVLVANATESSQITSLKDQVQKAHQEFNSGIQKALADGTTAKLLEPIQQQEKTTYSATLQQPLFWPTLSFLQNLKNKTQKIQALKTKAFIIELNLENQLHVQTLQSIADLTANIKSAQSDGLNTDKYNTSLSKFSLMTITLAIPSIENKTLQALQAELGKLNHDIDNQLIFQQAQRVVQQALQQAQQGVQQALQQAQSSLARAKTLNVDVTTDSNKLNSLSQQFNTATDLTVLQSIQDQSHIIKTDLDTKYNAAWNAAHPAPKVAGKIITVSLMRQELRAYQDGVMLLDTVVATGRPALSTPTGTFSIMAKYSPYRMVSPWPYGSPYYYSPVWMSYAMLWHDGGYFIHDAPWRTVWGPGANTTSGTHGCINVPLSGEAWLYNWAPIGTTIQVIAGDF
jgi:lipoprotein-anchoring transpeptidase ErfK/SrfK